MQSQVITKRFLLCPSCFKGEFQIEHLLEEAELKGTIKTFGFWYCDLCHKRFRGTVFPSGTISITEVKESNFDKVFSLLKFRDLYLVLKSDKIDGSDADNRDYFFHSHQCPTNLFHDVVDVFDSDGSDPHGQLRLVAEIPCTATDNKDPAEVVATLEELFKLFKTDGKPLPTNWSAERKGSL